MRIPFDKLRVTCFVAGWGVGGAEGRKKSGESRSFLVGYSVPKISPP